MPRVEVIKTDQPRSPSFQLIWDGDNQIPWQARVGAYLHWYKRFLTKYYGQHFYFEGEDIALSGSLETDRCRIYGVIHSWFIFQNEEEEKQAKLNWDEFILDEQDNDQDTARLLICPTKKQWIWRHLIGNVVIPDGVKLIPLDNMNYDISNKWYYAGIYEGEDDDYFYLHNWKTEYNSWVASKSGPLNNLKTLKEALPCIPSLVTV